MKSKRPWVLGISASHNGSACLLHGDEIVAAVQEERLTRVKRQRILGASPAMCIQYCLETAKISASDLDSVVLSVQGHSEQTQNDLAANPILKGARLKTKSLVIPHHLGHAYAVFATSGFREAAVLVVDGMGSPCCDLTGEEKNLLEQNTESGFETVSLYFATGTRMIPLQKHSIPDSQWLKLRDCGMPLFTSLGAMYSAVAWQVFGNTMEAGKVMGLAPYGEQRFKIDDFFDVTGKGNFVFKKTVPFKFRHDRRWRPKDREYEDLAKSVQVALEEAVLILAKRLKKLSGSDALCLAGGVALNGIANERVIWEAGFSKVYVQPAAEDSGVSIGAAFYGLWHLTGENTAKRLNSDSLGRCYSKSSIKRMKVPKELAVVTPRNLEKTVVDLLGEARVLGWFSGGSELGPRALGQRSILADPRSVANRERINRIIKQREGFRPLAPAILDTAFGDWFCVKGPEDESPFMLRVLPFRGRAIGRVPAVVHVDGTGRPETVGTEQDKSLQALLKVFQTVTGVPMVLNTSFNSRGEPIVETPRDALKCVLNSGLDGCVLEGVLFLKKRPIVSASHWKPK